MVHLSHVIQNYALTSSWKDTTQSHLKLLHLPSHLDLQILCDTPWLKSNESHHQMAPKDQIESVSP